MTDCKDTKRENEEEVFNGIQNQIGCFDNKAGLMLSIVGIVFALALSFLDVFHSDFYSTASSAFKTWYVVLFVALLAFTIGTIFCFILVIFPRKNRTGKQYPNYYMDICKMEEKQLIHALSDYVKEDKMLIGQIKINARICKRKHEWFVRDSISLFFFVLLIVALSLMIVFA